MKARPIALFVLLVAGLAACGEAPDVSPSAVGATARAVSSNGVTAELTIQSDWGAGFCANAVLTNASASPVTSWTLVIELNQATVSQQPWGATATQSGSQLTARPVSYTASIAPGTSVSFGFCGAANGSNDRPALVSLSVVGGGTGEPSYPLTVKKAGTGGGTVTGSAIDCGSSCSGTYASGASVVLTATASSGSAFAGWTGACTGTSSTCTVAMTAAREVTATFDLSQVTTYALGVTRSGSGSGTVTSSPAGISCGSTCSASFASGTTVTLTATPASGSTFAGWSGACVGTTTCALSMTAARTVTAQFDPPASETGISIDAGGSGTGSFVADAWYAGGSTYSTTSTIDTSQLSSPVPPQTVLQTERYGEFTYTVPNRAPGSAQTVTLYFVESYWTAAGQRTFDVAINGAKVLTAFDIYAAAGRNRAIARTFSTAANASGQVVIQFTKGGGPDNPKVCGVTVAGEQGSGTSYTLGVTRSGTGSGTVTGGGIDCGSVCSAAIASGTSVTLTASAASNSTFTSWGGSCSGAANTCVLSMNAARSVTATFTAVGGAYNPCPTSGDCRILPLGDSITDGFNVPGGYRIELFRKARAAAKRFTFVGSLVNGPTTVDGVSFPRNHEGHSGWTISQIAGLVPSPALSSTPHVVLLMIGTNDMYGSTTGVPAAVQRLDALLGKLVSAAPNALIVVAQITPLSDANRATLARSYNAGIPAIVNARASQGQHVVLVDMSTGFPLSELADGTHPNAAGYARMANVWYAAIGPLLR